MQTQEQRKSGTPSENFGVLRLRRPVLNAFSTVGMMLTSYAGGGRNNVGLGADGSFRVMGDEFLTLKYAGTVDEADGGGVTFARRSLFDLRWERRTGRGLQYNINSTRMGRDFRPELGFLQRRDFTTANVVGNYYFFTDRSRIFRRVYPGALAFSTFRNSSGVLESGQYAFWVQWDTKAGGGGWVEPKWFHDDVAQGFDIGRVHIPKGSYDYEDLQINLSMAAGRKVRTGMDFRTGSYFDGTRTQLVLTPTWNLSRHFEVGGDYQFTRLRFEVRDQKENVQVARLRVRAALDARASGNAFVQFNSVSDRLDFNVRLRYAFAEGTDLWLVYNEGVDTDPLRDPLLGISSPTSLARSVILKYTHTLGF